MNTMEPMDSLTDETKEWGRELGIDIDRVSQLAFNTPSQVAQALDAALVAVNKDATSNAQKIQKWAILPVDFSIPGGELGKRYVAHL